MSPTVRNYWGTQRVARACQVAPATVAHWIDQGLLKGHRTPTGRRRVHATELVKFLRSRDMPVPPDLRAALGRDVIVLVEDDPAYRDALSLTMQRSNLDADIVTASNGVDALLEIGRVRPALIVLDFGLPDINAVQVIERLLEPGRHLDAEIMVVTGGIEERDHRALEQLGVKAIVNKCDGLHRVVEAIRQAMERRKVA